MDDQAKSTKSIMSMASALGYLALLIALITKEDAFAFLAFWLITPKMISDFARLFEPKPELQQSAKLSVRQLEQSKGRRRDCDLIVEDPGDRAVQTVQALNEVYFLSLKESNRLANYSWPIWFQKKKISSSEAEYVKSRLEAVGAVARITSRH
jgi:ribosomal protein L7/L12